MCHEEFGRYTVETMDFGACLSNKVISEVFSVFELQIERDEISEIKSSNEMLESLLLVRVKDDLIDWFKVAERK